MPENQTAWNSDNEGIQTLFNQTCRKERGSQAVGGGPWQRGRPSEWGRLRGPPKRLWTLQAGLAERTHHKAVDHLSEAGMAEWETKTQSWPQTRGGC